MRGKQFIKILKALELLSSPNGTSIQDMAEDLNIDTRSVYRMLETMQDAGFPIWDEKVPFDKKKRWKIEDTFLLKLPNIKLPNFNLTFLEIILLYVLKNHSSFFQGTLVEKHINSAFFKINQFVPDATKKITEKINKLFITKSLPPKLYEGKENIIEHLIEFMIRNESCSLKYHSFYDDKFKDMKIDPFHFFESHGGLYILVRKTGQNDIRILAVERIIELEGTNQVFKYPDNIKPETYLDSSFDIIAGEQFFVQLWFSKDQARYIKERNWSHTQEIQENQDGSIIFSMYTSGWRDIKKWILSYGPETKVLKPQKMIDEIVKDVQNIIKGYKKK